MPRSSRTRISSIHFWTMTMSNKLSAGKLPVSGKHFNCVVGVPSGNFWYADFAVDLISLVSNFTKVKVPGYASQELRVVNVKSSILPKNRLELVRAAQAAKATHLLFIDTDHTFPITTVHQLASLHKMVVAANCVTKCIPAQPTGRRKAEDLQGEIVYTDMDDNSLEQVWRIGTGIMLIDMRVFEKIGNSVWEMKYLPHADTYQGEDWTFCEACEKAGIDLFVDHNLSWHVGHVGNYEFKHDVVGAIVS